MKDKTILLVEDEVMIAGMEKMMLEDYGYKVQIVNSGEKQLIQLRPILILT
jgi:DNA-binding response OmpR family regulator